MHSPKILEKYGITQQLLRDIFTANSPSKDEMLKDGSTDEDKKAWDDKWKNWKIRRRFEDKVQARIFEGVQNNACNSRIYQAVDLAWDAPPIQKDMIPLLLYAQGKIDVKKCYNLCVPSGATTPPPISKFFKKEGDTITGVDFPKLCEININLIRSYVTRRHAALNAQYANQWPFFRYEPRGTDDVTKLRADALSQRVDVMADDYNYRHFRSQCNRQALLYARSTAFPRSAWDKKTGWRFKDTNTGQPSEETESYVIREGVDFVNPHPSRVFWDASAPLANINTDNGPKYVGYWDIIRYGDLNDAGYFNIDHIYATDGWLQLISQYADFFYQYFDPTILALPVPGFWKGDMLAFWNTRQSKIGRYSSEYKDQGVLITQYFEKINPKECGIGEYDTDIWIRLSVAGDFTIVGAEFMPSIPCCYGGINENDDRFVNMSMAMELLPYQDQATNIITQMLQQIRASMMMLVLIDKDALDPEIVETLKKQAGNKDWWVDPQYFIYEASKLRELGVQDPRQMFAIVQAQMGNAVAEAVKGLGELMNFCDRIMILSQNELGQPNPREVAAREVQEISNSTIAIQAFNNEGIDEQNAAMKRLIFHALMCHGSANFRVPVTKRYTKATIKAAGLEVDTDKKDVPPDYLYPIKTPVIGTLPNLLYDYYFDTRDGSARALNPQSAQVLTQMSQMLLSIPPVAEAMGKARIFDLMNNIVRLSGAPFDLNLEVNDGEDDKMPNGEESDMQKQVQQLQQQMQTLMQALHIVPPEQPGAQPGPPQPGGPPQQQMPPPPGTGVPPTPPPPPATSQAPVSPQSILTQPQAA